MGWGVVSAILLVAASAGLPVMAIVDGWLPLPGIIGRFTLCTKNISV